MDGKTHYPLGAEELASWMERFVTEELKTYEEKVLTAEERRVARELELFEPQLDEHPPLRLHLPPTRLDDATIDRLQELIGDFPGESEVHILLGEKQVLRLSDDHLVNTQSGIIGELRALLGHEAVVI